jgi:tRNA-specific 2-thiouridylase
MTKPLTIVALSGGVDSAVAALLLRDAGHDVQCLHMTNWEDDGYCDNARDFQDARRTCQILGLPLHRANFAGEYREQVFAHFLAEHRLGRTPNPDVLCNREIKFGVMRAYARRLGATSVATGHYARVRLSDGGHGGDRGDSDRGDSDRGDSDGRSDSDRGNSDGRDSRDRSAAPAAAPQLLKARDASKDQSYFLHAVSPNDLRDVLFPLGDLLKSEVRDLARNAALPVADKKDSTGICFIGERPFAEFLATYLPPQPGAIVDERGRERGRHDGLAYYTLGQRHGLLIGGTADGGEDPWYVARKDPDRNELVVVQGRDHPLLLASGLTASGMHWIGAPPSAWTSGEPFRCAAKIRYRQPDQLCTVRRTGDGTLEALFDQPQRTPTPGQYVVLYDRERCLGGATIERAVDGRGSIGESRTAPNRAPHAA